VDELAIFGITHSSLSTGIILLMTSSISVFLSTWLQTESLLQNLRQKVPQPIQVVVLAQDGPHQFGLVQTGREKVIPARLPAFQGAISVAQVKLRGSHQEICSKFQIFNCCKLPKLS